MANRVNTYDPKEIIVIVGGVELSGFAESRVTVERVSPSVEDEVGSDGDVARWLTNDRRGIITLSLLPTSLSNAFLSGLIRVDELSGDSVIPVIIRDNRGNDLHIAPNAWIAQYPRTVYRKGIEAREWTIRTSNLQMVVAGTP